MDLTFISDILNNTFNSFDYSILNFWHTFAINTSGVFNIIFELISLIAEKGILFILLSIILMLFKDTRKYGICMFGAIALGAIITNLTLKDAIARPRPYTIDTYKSWWELVGAIKESDFSFPSGHTTATFAALTSLILLLKSRKKWLLIIPMLLVGISRNYLMVHYPTDVIAGAIVGLLSALIAYIITKWIYKLIDKYNNKFFNFIKNFDIRRKHV